MEYISTTNLAKKHQLEAKDLFERLSFQHWIEKKNDKWTLTELGKDHGGVIKKHPQYGEYIGWPENQNIVEQLERESLMTSTYVGAHFRTSSKRMNLILSELGWIQKNVSGWIVTKQGSLVGGKQFEHDKTGNKFVLWPKEILINPSLREVFEETTKRESEKSADDKKPAYAGDEFREKYPAKIRTQDGHYVRSRAELVIDNLLYQYQLVHAYERKLPVQENIYCDFYLPAGKVYIEFWGLENEPKYLERKRQKLQIYKKYECNLIELTESDIENLDDILPKKLLEFQIRVY